MVNAKVLVRSLQAPERLKRASSNASRLLSREALTHDLCSESGHRARVIRNHDGHPSRRHAGCGEEADERSDQVGEEREADLRHRDRAVHVKRQHRQHQQRREGALLQEDEDVRTQHSADGRTGTVGSQTVRADGEVGEAGEAARQDVERREAQPSQLPFHAHSEEEEEQHVEPDMGEVVLVDEGRADGAQCLNGDGGAVAVVEAGSEADRDEPVGVHHGAGLRFACAAQQEPDGEVGDDERQGNEREKGRRANVGVLTRTRTVRRRENGCLLHLRSLS